jgi:hypothetical protein
VTLHRRGARLRTAKSLTGTTEDAALLCLRHHRRFDTSPWRMVIDGTNVTFHRTGRSGDTHRPGDPDPGTASKLTPPRGGDDTVIVGDAGVDEDVRHRYRSGADGELGSGAEGGRETAPAFGVPRRPSSPVLL